MQNRQHPNKNPDVSDSAEIPIAGIDSTSSVRENMMTTNGWGKL